MNDNAANQSGPAPAPNGPAARNAAPEIAAQSAVSSASEVAAQSAADAAPEVAAQSAAGAAPANAAPEIAAQAAVRSAPEVAAQSAAGAAPANAAPEIAAQTAASAAPEIAAQSAASAAPEVAAPAIVAPAIPVPANAAPTDSHPAWSKAAPQARDRQSPAASAYLSALTIHTSNAILGIFFLDIIVAVAAFLKRDQPAFLYCLLGAFAAVIGAVFTYLAQRFYMNADQYSYATEVMPAGNKPPARRKFYERYITGFAMTVMACLFVFISLFIFMHSAWIVL